MNWQEIRDELYYIDGSWRDIYIQNTTKEDWRLWSAYVNEHHKVKWLNGKTNTTEDRIDFDVILEFWNGNHDFCSIARVFIDTLQINAHFFTHSEIENDIDPREFNGIEDHIRLVKYLADLSDLLRKEVIITPENEPDVVLLKVMGKG